MLMARSDEHSYTRRDGGLGPLFGESENNLPLLDQFWVGVMKSLINGVIDLVNLLKDGLVYSARSSCYSMTFKLGSDQKGVDKVREGCAEVFKPQKPIPTIPYNGEIETAGGIFADVVSIIFAVNDLAQAAGAAKWVGRIGEVMTYFKPKASGAGKILEAEGKGGKVQLFNDYGDGKPVPWYTEQSINDLKSSTEHNAFRNCAACGGRVRKRQRGVFTRILCCRATPSREPEIIGGTARNAQQQKIMDTYKTHVNIDEAIPQAQRVIGNTYPASREQEVIDKLAEGAQQFRKYYIDGRPDPPTISRAMQVFYNQLKEQYEVLSTRPWLEDQYRVALIDASRQMWGLSYDEVVAVEEWVSSGLRNQVNLEAALRKMNPVKTWTITQQNPPTEVLNMLIKAESGIESKGPKGIYTLRDIKRSSTFADIRPTNREPIAFATSMGMFPAYMPGSLPVRYVIYSETGRYVASVSGTAYHEVMFHERLCGKFQLLGHEEVNGGLRALREGRTPPFVIFYFREIEAPAFNPLPEPPNLPIIRKIPHRLAKL
ncbi:hypothetical protein IWZ03DRAFT_127373 [Phyllosticta citriasiana]|uniref:Uncharacterized protein n=2 Tax=Phyllosticta citriasiana TaxID=595635 RepID=A0ABR1KR46_9PEZI